MSAKPTYPNKGKYARSRRVGRVTIYRRGAVWYLYYFENSRRVRRRVGTSLDDAKTLAAQVNAQLATGARAMMSFEPVSIHELRRRWLDHHKHVLRSSIATIRRYRAATDHFLRFASEAHPAKLVDKITASDVERFVRYLRDVKEAPNGHENTAKRSLRDKGIVFILESCRAMFNYAAKHRHLPPYHENPFVQISIERIPIEDAKHVEVFTPEQEAAFLAACDDWQFPIFLTLGLTGMRPGEVVHLLLPVDVNLKARLIRIRNKSDLGWRTKTRNERDIPVCPELCDVLRRIINGRTAGPLFLRRRFATGKDHPMLGSCDQKQLAAELVQRVACEKTTAIEPWTRFDDARVAKTVWRDAGAIKETTLRVEFMKVTATIGLAHLTCPTILRHLFATCLQDANIDPLIRQELMGHAQSAREKNGLGMTTVYTHTRDATYRSQFADAMKKRGTAIRAARRRLEAM